ncbi:MAG: hypothetical protein HUU33_05905 [Flavobacteriales bacterium]|nr:hypothetical protein [Flavobacteriales bacterium]
MPLNLIKRYPELLDIGGMSEASRTASLRGVFQRDIENNPAFAFRKRPIYPIKGEEPAMQLLFRHLTTVEVLEVIDGTKRKSRIFELERSRRLHWVLPHIQEGTSARVEVFSAEDRVDDAWKVRTYILNHDERYVVVLEPNRKPGAYYLITAYHLDRDHSYRKMMKKAAKRKLPDVR